MDIDHDGTKVSRARFEANLAAKSKDRAFVEDAIPLLAPNVSWDFESALEAVSSRLVTMIPGAPWRGTESQSEMSVS